MAINKVAADSTVIVLILRRQPDAFIQTGSKASCLLNNGCCFTLIGNRE